MYLERVRPIYIFLGTLFLAVGVAGIFVPLLPTTPFLLLTAFFYSKGSRRLHRKLLEHPRLGPFINDWNRHGVIRPRSKALAVLLLFGSLGYALIFKEFALGLKLAAAAIGLAVLAFILTRPSSPKTS